ncbi:MAG: hypothetical protein IT233_07240 [Bacteroidia bacterium]|nr:hypothetical protein [Bacteroidia bacterium]
MKKVLVSILVFFVLLVLAAGFTSCEKNSPAPQNSITQTPVNTSPALVKYSVYGESADLTVRYTVFENGMLTVVEKYVLRADEKFEVEIPRNNQVSIEAWNTKGERKEIVLEIHSDGVIQTSASLNFNTGVAAASVFIR